MNPMTTFAGNGKPAHSGDGGLAKNAGISDPFTLTFDKQGNLFVAEAGVNAVRRIDARTKIITTFYDQRSDPMAIQTPEDLVAITAWQDSLCTAQRLTGKLNLYGNLDENGNYAEKWKNIGSIPRTWRLQEPHDVAALPAGRWLYIADVKACVVYRYGSGMSMSEPEVFAGTGKRAHTGDGGLATEASIFGARAVCCFKNLVYIVEREGNCVRKVDEKGIMTTIAGTGKKGYSGDGGLALEATFNGPKGAACDRWGNLFVVDTENHVIRRIDAKTGVISTVAMGLNRPHGVALGPDGALYIADTLNCCVRRVAKP